MLNIALALLKEFLGSKKALATLAAILVWLIAKVGLDVDVETVAPILGLIAAYVLAQGWADTGKEAMKVKAAALEASALDPE